MTLNKNVDLIEGISNDILLILVVIFIVGIILYGILKRFNHRSTIINSMHLDQVQAIRERFSQGREI